MSAGRSGSLPAYRDSAGVPNRPRPPTGAGASAGSSDGGGPSETPGAGADESEGTSPTGRGGVAAGPATLDTGTGARPEGFGRRRAAGGSGERGPGIWRVILAPAAEVDPRLVLVALVVASPVTGVVREDEVCPLRPPGPLVAGAEGASPPQTDPAGPISRAAPSRSDPPTSAGARPAGRPRAASRASLRHLLFACRNRDRREQSGPAFQGV